MAGENTVATLNGLFKTVYAEKLLDLVPDFAILQKKIPFSSADKELGALYAQPVNLTHEHGFSYLGDTGAAGSLADAINGTMKEAQVKGSELVLKSVLTYGALARASKAGPKAFKKASAWKVLDMNNSMRKRLEIASLYGQVGIGTVESITSASGSGTITLTAASWSGGIWAGMEGAKVDSFTTTTKNNGSGDITITGINADTRTLTVTCTGTFSGECAAGDVLYFKGANAGSSSFNEMAGLQKIITNSTSLFNIDASTYSLWKGNTDAAFGEPSLLALQRAIAKCVNKGLMEKVVALVSPKFWAEMNTDQSALRQHNKAGGKGDNSFESLSFYATCGEVELISHPLVKDGDVFIVPLESVMRLGSLDLSFTVPGMEEQFFRITGSGNTVELQCMADQAIFLEKPAHAYYGAGVSYT